MIFSRILSTPHINLYYTNSVSNDDVNEIQHDCFRVTSSIDEVNISQQIIYYCMYELPTKSHIEKDDSIPKFTFVELSKLNITSQQLYLWSAPIDIIEDYQFYLDNLLTSNHLISENEVFFNCTLPRFGSICQYEFDYYHSNHSSLHHIIRDFYVTYQYNLTHLTCYIHIQCDRVFFSSCLDWTDICDGQLDCRDNGLDEKYCWELEFNECDDNEYRCLNGQCISQSFISNNRDSIIPYCLDKSDIKMTIDDFIRMKLIQNEPSIGYEDMMCQTVTGSRSCIRQRRTISLQTLFSIKDDNISNDCWSAWKCIIGMSSNELNQTCNHPDGNRAYMNIIYQICPDIIFIPVKPILFNDIYFAFAKNATETFIHLRNPYPYVCYNSSHYDNYFVDHFKFIFQNVVCSIPKDQYELIIKPYDWINYYAISLYRELDYYDAIWKYTPEICNKSNMYRCANSSKCISIYRLLNSVKDCPYNDDEEVDKIDIINRIQHLERYYYKCPLTNKTISKYQINNIACDCEVPIGNWCEDEYPKTIEARTKISFPTICDGFTELYPKLIDKHFHTDETECEQWSCNNTYTHCDNIWNCPNGADEVGCYVSPTLNCSSNEHICVSSYTKQFMCLNLMKVNDSTIDCLGAFDELQFCRIHDENNAAIGYSCMANRSRCFYLNEVCNNKPNCPDGEDEQICNRMNSSNDIVISSSNSSYRLNTIEFIRKTIQNYFKKPLIYFSLDGIENLIDNQVKTIEYRQLPHLSLINNSIQKKLECYRGFDIRLRLNNKSNSTTNLCFCPSNYYGNQCQYQNQRVSLAIQCQASSHSWQTLFAIMISLIDDDQRMIHSYEQFSYLSARDCNIKFKMYLLYSTKPKNINKNYSIHIDIYEKFSLAYRGSLLFPIKFTFLPVHRLPIILSIPNTNDTLLKCLKDKCIHGKCIQYWNNLQNTTFCQCNQGWSGQYCTIPHQCQCSSNALCIGVDIKNRSVCICPIHQFGPRCLIIERICTDKNINLTCENGGRCIPNDEYIESDQKFTCICPRGFFGKRCEFIENRLIFSFDKDIILTQIVFIHFIQIIKDDQPRRITTFRTINSKQQPVQIFWSKPFHLVFIEISTEKKDYYLTIIQNYSNQSTIINKTIHSSDRCYNISEIFNKTIIQLDLIRRIKYYHLPCRMNSLNISCFYDDAYLCLCQQHLANCFDFNHNRTFDCSDQSECENDGKCFLDWPECPAKSTCMCPICYYGTKCQFYTSRFALSLDAIIGPHISPSLSFTQQSLIIKITLTLTIVWIVTGLVNGILSIITFKNKKVCAVGCGLYLLGSSITTLLITIMFGLKFLILILSQLKILSNQSFLLFQCRSIDFLLRICLSMDQWLNGCVALERTLTVIKGTSFNRKNSKRIAKYVIIILIILIIGSSIHDPIYRRLINEEENDDSEKRIWCIAIYSDKLQTFDSFIHSFHVLIPFLINFLSIIILVTKKSDQQSTIQINQTYREILREQFQQHKHIFISAIVLVILALPRVIIAFAIKCMKSIDDSWIFLIGYFLSFIPPMLTFIVFVLPSKFYKKQFRQTVVQYRIRMQRRFHFI